MLGSLTFLRVKTALPPGLGACACFGLELKRGWGRKVETGRWIGPWHGVCLLWPLPLLLSKLVSKLDVLPGQFEVALLPPPPASSPANTEAARCQCRPGGLGEGDRVTWVHHHQGLEDQERPHYYHFAGLGSNLVACQHLSQNFGKLRKSVFKAVLLPISTRERYPVAIWLPARPYFMLIGH